eukprot:1162109-Pelagomonas_calceolata.AAC.1
MVWRSTTFALMGLQRSAFCRCAASNCCPGLVSSQYLTSIKCTCRWFTVDGVASRGWLLWSSVWGCACCITHDGSNQYSIRTVRGESRSLRQFLGNRDLKVVLCQPITTSYVHVCQACFPRAFAKSLMLILPAILWRSVFMQETI